MSASLVLAAWADTEYGTGSIGRGQLGSIGRKESLFGGHSSQAASLLKRKRYHHSEIEQKRRKMVDNQCYKKTIHSLCITIILVIYKTLWKKCKAGLMSHKIRNVWFYYYRVSLLLLQGVGRNMFGGLSGIQKIINDYTYSKDVIHRLFQKLFLLFPVQLKWSGIRTLILNQWVELVKLFSLPEPQFLNWKMGMIMSTLQRCWEEI